ncbi:4-(cytidine 5'-diphospho)-2-C-methyl-D-erythritol kinase [Rhizorhapis sp. SPR117]|uniref:4-(cytidine 5'-diphospho)-2-C-methyl-D-erythritol kinase n=1 Tax=Rhizorhapis sp. SPR117 TaxID=2912611 RepID=UPI001F00F294|nr:4-(cytidine 5'-diphospho)-2-C-methyl-D-erythritol kinase [Rhizorhapis sp. SPR117]
MLTETAYAKINLALHVRARRADGFHQIESLFAFAEHGDVVSASVREDGDLSLIIDGPFARDLNAGPDNLVLRAARILKRRFDVAWGADIHLVKNLPVASGIGGGSADAAAALRLLSRLWGLDSAVDMLPLAAELGSDVPACFVSRTLMGTGRGEELELREIDGLSGMPLLLVNPRVSLSTAAVFTGWDQQDRGALIASNLSNILLQARNDLQSPAMALVPQIADVLAVLEGLEGLLLARMSGSGATCFALLHDEYALNKAAAELKSTQPGWWTMASKLR